jgi:hypothetical protein
VKLLHDSLYYYKLLRKFTGADYVLASMFLLCASKVA